MNLYRIAQQITDDVFGKGTYKRVNKFDPSKGETYKDENKLKKKTKKKNKP
jgi:hypothetical protein